MAEPATPTAEMVEPKNTVGVNYARGIIPSKDREKDDFYPTPPEATDALLAVEKFDGPIWECACGDGAISRVLEAHGYDVVSTDLVNRGYGKSRIDFLLEHERRAPNIITNPPFKLAEEFLEKALALTTGKVAMLLRLAFLEGQDRKLFYDRSPIARVWVFSWRVKMNRSGAPLPKGKGGMIAFAWLVFEHGHDGPPTLGWL